MASNWVCHWKAPRGNQMKGEGKGQDSYFPSLLGHILGLASFPRSQLFPRSQVLLPLCPFRPRGGNSFTQLPAPGCVTTPSFPNLCLCLLLSVLCFPPGSSPSYQATLFIANHVYISKHVHVLRVLKGDR